MELIPFKKYWVEIEEKGYLVVKIFEYRYTSSEEYNIMFGLLMGKDCYLPISKIIKEV
jgi:hypothetical protein